MLRHTIPIVLGAFLLFLIQPLIGKFILPWFGGTPGVWTTCMLFFQVVLLGGYAYAHFSISCLRPRTQVAVHLSLLLTALLTLPVIPGESWKPIGTASSEWRILLLLTATVGLPLFVLSATAPLLQAWFSRRPYEGSPYRMYAFSNAAALLGLLCYPFWIEPVFSLKTQAWGWSAGYGLFTLSCAWCASGQWHRPPVQPADPSPATPPVQREGWALWLGLSTCGSVMLLATTSQLSQNVAVVPLLWVVPLGIYLLSFVVCFENPRWYWRPLWLMALPVALACAYVAPYFSARTPLLVQVPVYCTTLLIACMLCHGELARTKPASPKLTGFYLLVATGGALGGMLCSVLAPALFSGLWEYQCGITGLCALVPLALARGATSRWRLRPVHAWVLSTFIAGAVGYCFIAEARDSQTHAVFASRNFFGVLEIDEETDRDGPVRSLIHGRVSHGFQIRSEPLRRTPVAYYGSGSGLGSAESALRHYRLTDGPVGAFRTGAVGLGAGILAAYGQKTDVIRFYEINPEVVRLANAYFTYLSDSVAQVEMVPGDARLSMEQEREHGTSQQFDLLVLDAFSGDAIPLHLLTRQAFALYSYHLKKGGMIAVHISSQHLDLAPLLFGLAADCGMKAVLISDLHRDTSRFRSTRWILLSRNGPLMQEPEIAGRAEAPGPVADWLCFTDDYSNLFQLLRKDVPVAPLH